MILQKKIEEYEVEKQRLHYRSYKKSIRRIAIWSLIIALLLGYVLLWIDPASAYAAAGDEDFGGSSVPASVSAAETTVSPAVETEKEKTITATAIEIADHEDTLAVGATLELMTTVLPEDATASRTKRRAHFR
jgi:uncharacterized protein YjdB